MDLTIDCWSKNKFKLAWLWYFQALKIPDDILCAFKKKINNAAVLPQTNVTAERFRFWLEWMALTALFHTSPSSFAFQEKSSFGVLRGQSQAGNNSV